MARIKYYYDTEKCKYEKIEPKIGNILLNLFAFLFLSFVIGVALVFLYDRYYDFPGEEDLKNKLKAKEVTLVALQNQREKIVERLDKLEYKDKNTYRIILGSTDTAMVDEEHLRQLTIEEISAIAEGNSDLLTQILNVYLEDIVDLKGRIEKQDASYVFLQHLKASKDDRFASVPWITPIGKDQKYRVASGFGMRRHPVLGIRKMHTGIDYACKVGTPIRATGNGRVKRIKKSCCKGYGNMVDIDHGYGFTTRYAHMSKVLVKKGQKLKRGDIIGEVGSTGTSTGPHLHYEVIKNGKKNNPVLFVHDLSDEEYEEMLRIASEENEALSIPEDE